MQSKLTARSFLDGEDAIIVLRKSIRMWVLENAESDEWVLDSEADDTECRRILCGIWTVFLVNLHSYFNEKHPDLSSQDRSTIRQYCYRQVFGLMTVAPSAKWSRSAYRKAFRNSRRAGIFNNYFRETILPYIDRPQTCRSEDDNDAPRKRRRADSPVPEVRSCPSSGSC